MAPAARPRSAVAPRSAAAPATPEEKLVAALIAQLEAGTTPWRREWDAAGPGHHVNLFSGRRYRGANPVLLSLGLHRCGSALPYWCGYVEARAHGLVPRRGSKAVHVLRPQLHQGGEGRLAAGAQAEGTDPAPTAPTAPTDTAPEGGCRWVSYRPLPLFNVADLEGEGLPALVQARRQAEGALARPEPQRLAAAETVLAAWPVPVGFAGARACYLPGPDRIQLPERSAFHRPAALYATWAHEAIHSTGHRSRLARDLSGGMGSGGDGGRAYAREELVAELGAVLLGDRLEIGSAMANHAAYLGGWIALLRESPRLLLQVLGDARKAADLICPEPADDAG